MSGRGGFHPIGNKPSEPPKPRESWPMRSRRFERFRQSSVLEEETEELQSNSLINSMGDEAKDMIASLTDDQSNSYEAIPPKSRSAGQEAEVTVPKPIPAEPLPE